MISWPTTFPISLGGLFGEDFDWKNPGLGMSRLALNRDLLFARSSLLRGMAQDNYNLIATKLSESFRTLGDSKEQARVLRPFLSLFVANGFTHDPKNSKAEVKLG